MMLEALRKEVWRTNKLLPELGLVTFRDAWWRET